MSGNSSNIIAYSYFGGKNTFLPYLYEEFPTDFVHLVDLFAGSLAVSLNYNTRSVIKTANEINGDITNFFQVLRDNYDEFIDKLLLTPVSEQEFINCWEQSTDKIEQARRFYVRQRQSFMSMGAQKQSKGWMMAKTRINCRVGESVSKWNNAIPKLADVVNVIRQNFQIMNHDYAKCIDKTDFDKAFFYVDPPYPANCRASKNDYKFEFFDEHHEHLAEKLHNIQGYAMISSYENKLYEKLYSDWRKVKLPIKKNNIRSSEVEEIIWMNYAKPTNTTLTLFNYE